MQPGSRIAPAISTSLVLLGAGSLLAYGGGRGLLRFARDIQEQHEYLFGVLLLAVTVVGVVLIVTSLVAIVRREALSIERRGDALLIPDSGRPKRQILVADVVEIRARDDLRGRNVEICLRGGEPFVVNPTLYGGHAKLIAALRLLAEPGGTA